MLFIIIKIHKYSLINDNIISIHGNELFWRSLPKDEP